MKSNLFKIFAALPGINWFNWKEKIERELPMTRINPKLHEHNPELLYKMATKYFEKIVVQDKYIWVQMKLIDSFDEQVQKWDEIQAKHEMEVEEKTTDLRWDLSCAKERITILENKIKQLESRKQKVAIAGHDVNKLIKHLDTIKFDAADPYQKMVKKARMIHNTLHGFLQKLKAHADSTDTL